MERTIDPLLTIDAKLWADEFMATKARLGDKEFDHAMMLGWFANAIMRGYDEGKRLGADDAQATIAALQARVKELEEWQQIVAGTQDRQDLIYRLSDHLTQRTAELEAANKHWDALWNAACEQKDTLQAELERVRGELEEARELVAALSSKVAEYEIELNGDPQNFYGRGRTVGLRTLIAALPKVEGEIEVSSGVYNFILLKHDSGTRFLCGQIETEQTAKAYAALLKHRQGMEG